VPVQHQVTDERGLVTVPWVGFLRWIVTTGTANYLEGTHAARIEVIDGKPVIDPAGYRAGTVFYETDRTVYYRVQYITTGTPPDTETIAVWVYVSGTMRNTLANKPADLGIYDTNVLFHATDYAHTWRWTVISSYTDLAIGAANTQLTSAAYPFTAAHVGRILDITGGSGFTAGRYAVLSVAGSTATMDRPVGTASSTAGKGALTGWEYAPGDRPSGEIAWFTADPGTGWKLCNGTSTTRSNPDATTASFATPNLIGVYAKGGSAYTGGVAAGTGGTVTGSTAAESTHTHTVDPPLSTTSIPVNGMYAATGGGPGSFAGADHTHQLDIPPFTSAPGSAHSHGAGTLTVSGADVAHVDLLPYFRL
jgi:hypothetical protein